MLTNKEKMLNLVLDELSEMYDFDKSEYEDFHSALYSDNIMVATVARIIKEYNGTTDKAEKSRIYKSVFNFVNDNFVL